MESSMRRELVAKLLAQLILTGALLGICLLPTQGQGPGDFWNQKQGQNTRPRVDIVVSEPAGAFAHLDRNVAAAQKDPLNFLLVGEIQHELGHSGRAVKAFQRAVELDPLNPLCRYWLGLEYEVQGKKLRALRSYLTAQNLAQREGFSEELVRGISEAIARLQEHK
jgi:cytochrome c-type biogenesis protein CcmH/NrfG